MSEERARILKLLEDGKITAEEAARLIEALGKGDRAKELLFHVPKFGKGHHKEFDMIPDVVSRTVRRAVETGIGERMLLRTRKFSAKDEIAIRAVSSDIKIEGWDKDEILLESHGLGKVSEEDNQLHIKTLSGDMKLSLPMKTKLGLSTVSGDVELEKLQTEVDIHTVSGDIEIDNFEGKMAIKTVSGDVTGKDLNGNIWTKSQSGDIDLEFIASDQSEFETASGDIIITLPKDANLILELYTEEGEINLDIPKPYEEMEKEEGFLKIGLGDKKGKFVCRTDSGDIEIRK